MILVITFLNTRGVRLGKVIQNIFTSAKTLALVGLIFWDFRGAKRRGDEREFQPPVGYSQSTNIGAWREFSEKLCAHAYGGEWRLWIVRCLWCCAGWIFVFRRCLEQYRFTAAEVKNPKRDVALSMAFGTIIVIMLYCLANLAYLCTLPLVQIQSVPDGRVASAALNSIFGSLGAAIMAVAIIISTFGCNNGLILAGARVSYAMAKDGLFFRSTGTLNSKGVPGSALVYQGIWVAFLILMRTRKVDASGTVTYGNLYNDLLNYVVFAVLLFYALTIAGIFSLRAKRPDLERPYRAFGYPVVPALYIAAAVAIMFVLLLYQTKTAGAGLVIVLLGVPVYLWLRRTSRLAPGNH